MIRALPFFAVLVLPALVVLGVELGAGWTFLAAGAVYLGIPLLDLLGGRDNENPERGGLAWLFDAPLYLWAPLQIATTGWVVWRLALGDPTGLEVAGSVISLGAVNGAGGINVAHELMHRRGRAPRLVAEVLMLLVSYPWFIVEHVLGHHRHVATPRDSAFSRVGDDLYTFVARSLVRSLGSAWAIEGHRTRKLGISALSLRNRRLRYPLLLTALCVGITLLAGWVGLAVFLGQSAVAIFLLETINYLEHYGLERREIAPGRYERVLPQHSWNSNHRVTNWLLFNLARHSDHHYLASRPYRDLRHYDDVPQLPAGYSAMVLVALVPPLWWRVMDPRVASWAERKSLKEQPLTV